MTAPAAPRLWTRSRILALAGAATVAAFFVGANVHLIVIAVASQPDCVHPSSTEGAASYRAAKPSC